MYSSTTNNCGVLKNPTTFFTEVSIAIVDGAGASVSEQVCELGSTVALRCEVKGLRMEGGPSLLWYRKEDLLNDDTTRGGIRFTTFYIIVH